MSKAYALITGASGGIGEKLAHLFASDGIPLILVARNQKQLELVKQEISNDRDIDIRIYSSDLSIPGAAQEVYEWTKAQNLKVDYLVNNAGFGDRADVADAELDRLQSMIRLNIESLVSLSKLYGSDMVARKQGKIINIASVAGFVPGPGMAVYYASKAFVLNFSQALAGEFELYGVQVTCVCPGATKTGFAAAAHAENSRIFDKKLPSSEEVADFAYKAMKNGELVAIWGFNNRLIAKLVNLAPRRSIIKMVRRIQ